MNLDEVSLVDDPANQGAQVVLYKKAGGTKEEKMAEKATAEQLQEEVQKNEQLQEQLTSAKTQLEELQIKLKEHEDAAARAAETTAKAQAREKSEKDLLKSANPKLREHVLALEKRVDETAKRAEKAEKEAREERDARVLAGFEKRVKREFDCLPGTTSEKATFLKAASETLEADHVERLEELLVAGEKALEQLFHSGGHEAPITDAEKQLESIAAGLVEKGKAETKEQGLDLAYKQRPDLVAKVNQVYKQ